MKDLFRFRTDQWLGGKSIGLALDFSSLSLLLFLSFWIERPAFFLLAILLLVYFYYINNLLRANLKRHIYIVLLFGKCIFSVIIIYFFSTTYLIDWYRVSSESMETTFFKNDVLLVSKIAYGARIFDEKNSIFKRMKGVSHVKDGDILVFNFPPVDTARLKKYSLNRNAHIPGGHFLDIPIANKTSVVKRCIALPGDTLFVKNGVVYINHLSKPSDSSLKLRYTVKYLDYHGYNLDDIRKRKVKPNLNTSDVLMSSKDISALRGDITIIELKRNLDTLSAKWIFPHSDQFKWSPDNWGPMVIPKKGDSTSLNLTNIVLFKDIIQFYEGHQLTTIDSTVYIDGVRCNVYTFKKNYFFVMGDNRYQSIDSRYWGFVPEDHIIGKVIGVVPFL